MTWADQIDAAMERTGSPYTVLDLLRWLRTGQAKMAISGGLHGSVWFRPDGGCEIGHLCGAWTEKDARWLFSKLKEVAQGCFVEINGRRGWERFLKLKGWDNGRIGWR